MVAFKKQQKKNRQVFFETNRAWNIMWSDTKQTVQWVSVYVYRLQSYNVITYLWSKVKNEREMSRVLFGWGLLSHTSYRQLAYKYRNAACAWRIERRFRYMKHFVGSKQQQRDNNLSFRGDDGGWLLLEWRVVNAHIIAWWLLTHPCHQIMHSRCDGETNRLVEIVAIWLWWSTQLGKKWCKNFDFWWLLWRLKTCKMVRTIMRSA